MRHPAPILLTLLLAIAACSRVTDVTADGKDTYLVGSEVRGGFSSWTEVKALAIKRADDYCAGLGREMVPGPLETHGVRGWSPQEAEFRFQCLTADDPRIKGYEQFGGAVASPVSPVAGH